MIDQKHYEALVANHNKLKKQNVQLHAAVEYLKKDADKFRADTKLKLESVIRLYDKHNEKVLSYLRNNEIYAIHIQNVAKLFPIKIGVKNEKN